MGYPSKLVQQQQQEPEKDVSNDHKQDSWKNDKEDDSEEQEDDDEDEVVLGKGFDYVSSDNDDYPVALKQQTMMMMQQLHTKMRELGPQEEFPSDQEQHQVLRPPPPNETEEEQEPIGPKPQKQTTTTSSSRPRPCNFSTIDPYPSNGQLPNLDPPLQVQSEAGQCLYLPASWFHCVFSSSTSAVLSSNGSTPRTTTTKNRNDDSIHLAVNYWYHPPDNLEHYQEPYRDVAFWKDYKSKHHAQNDDDNNNDANK